MTDRATGGSADLSAKSTIEIMQNRRLLRDDELGVEEFLNETDSNGHGLMVTQRYWLQIFDQIRGESKQRNQQINIDQPLNYMFIFDFKIDSPKPQTPGPLSDLAMKHFAKMGTVKLIPQAKNQIVARLEHLSDRFDRTSNYVLYFNLLKYARDLYIEVNQGPPKLLDITETTLSGS
jgi:hypothetical protein